MHLTLPAYIFRLLKETLYVIVYINTKHNIASLISFTKAHLFLHNYTSNHNYTLVMETSYVMIYKFTKLYTFFLMFLKKT